MTALAFLAGATEQDQARGRGAGHHLPRPGPLGQGRLDDRLAVGGPLHPRRRDRLDGRGVRRARPLRPFPSEPRVADEQLGSPATCSPRRTARSPASTTRYDDIAFYPKSYDKPIPIWCGGESRGAQRRAGRPRRRLVSVLPARDPGGAGVRFANVREAAKDAGRDPTRSRCNCCLSVEVTDEPVEQEPDILRGSPEQVAEALRRFADVGVEHVGLQFLWSLPRATGPDGAACAGDQGEPEGRRHRRRQGHRPRRGRSGSSRSATTSSRSAAMRRR